MSDIEDRKEILERVIRTDDSKQLPAQFFKKSHDLVFSQLSMTPREHDIMALLLIRLHKDHWSSFIDGTAIRAPVYQFNSDVLTEWFGVKKDDLYNTLFQPSDTLSAKRIGLRNPEKKEFDFINLFKRLTYKNATLTIIPNDELINEYLGISQGHAQVDHRVFRKLKKEHSKRLYPLLCRFKSNHTQLHPLSIEELHSFFGLLNNKGELLKKSYANNKVFMDRCIRATIDEIQQCDPHIEFQICGENGTQGYRAIKHGRRIAKIEFLFRWRQPKNKEEQAERAKIGREYAPLEIALMVYQLVESFIPGEAGNPTVNELNNMMMYSAQLIEQGCKLDGEFMAKFSQAMAETMPVT